MQQGNTACSQQIQSASLDHLLPHITTAKDRSEPDDVMSKGYTTSDCLLANNIDTSMMQT